MPRIKYRYNPHTLDYEQVKPGAKDYIITILLYSFVVAAIAFGSIFIFSTFVENPKEKALKRDLVFAQRQIEKMQAELDTLESIAVDLQLKDDEVYRSIFGAEPFPEYQRRAGIGGSDRYKNLYGRRLDDAIEKLIAEAHLEK